MDLDEIYQLPASLEKLEPLLVKVKIGNMARVKDSEKNKERVERKLLVKNLFVCLDREGFATFYNDDIPIIFHSGNQKSKEKEEKTKPTPDTNTPTTTTERRSRRQARSETESSDKPKEKSKTAVSI